MTDPFIETKIRKIIEQLEDISIDQTSELDEEQSEYLEEALEALRNMLEDI